MPGTLTSLFVALAIVVAMFLQSAGLAGVARAVDRDGVRTCEWRCSPARAGVIAALGGRADGHFLEDEP